jgi:glycosyltransferase involved in cell wall biosynthesis
LLLDISETCRTEQKTGIQRAARSLVLAFLERPPEGFRVEPVYLSDEGGAWHHRYARRFTLDLLVCPPDPLVDDNAVKLQEGDVLFGLDISGGRLIEAERAGLLAEYRSRGVTVYFTVYDLLPLRFPQHFPSGGDEAHEKWLRALLETDGALCISRTVADHLRDWRPDCGPLRQRPFRIGWFHLGANPPTRVPKEAARDLAALGARPSFLMVGTIEPRKGYLQVFDAFDQLWNEGLDVNLTIVGAEGWLHVPQGMRRTIPQILARLQSHPTRGRRLFWMNACSDEYLEKIYAASSCLIAASEDEGFGLPLIEAARHKLSIIARDIPIFREVAGDHAFYFTGKEPGALAEAIKEWLTLYDRGLHPRSDAMPWLTWKQSAERLQEILLRGDWYYLCLPNGGAEKS